MRFVPLFNLPLLFFFFGPVSPLSAGPLAVFDFEAPDFQTGPLHQQQQWQAPDPQWEVVLPGLSGPIVPGGYQSLRLTGPANNAERATYALPPQEDTLFLRLNLRHANEGSVSGGTSSNFFWVALKSSAEPNPDNATLGFVLRSEGGWGVQARVRDKVNINAPSSTIPMQRGATYTVVLKVEKSGNHGDVYDRANVWVNPDLDKGTTMEAAGPPDGVATGSTGATFLDQLFLRSGHEGALYENQTITLDEIMIAGQWEDLTVEAHGASVGEDDFRYREDPARPRDYARDGTPDMLRRVLGQDFRQPSAPPFITMEGDFSEDDVLLSYQRSDDESMDRYRSEVQRSADLLYWHDGEIEQEFEVTLPGDGRRHISARIANPETTEFFRVQVTDRQRMGELTFSSLAELFQKMVVSWSTNIHPSRTRDLSGQNPDYESVTRMLVPLALWLSQPGRETVFTWNGETVDLTEMLSNALINGTDPGHPDRWPLATRWGDQIIVEAPQVALASWLLAKAHDNGLPGQSAWNNLTSTHRENLETFLAASGQSDFSYNNNWNLFLVLNHEARKQLRSMGHGEFDFQQDVIDNRMARIQNLHRGEGWYSDWISVDVFDDYMPWALLAEQMQYFILRGNVADEETVIPGTSGRSRADILEGVANWLEYQILTFDAFGGNPEYGRSSTYKFARLRSLVLAYYIDQKWNTPDRWDLGFAVLPESISVGQLRRLLRLHLNHYLANGMIDPETFALHEGQTPETASSLIDHYTRDGSRYWAMFPLGELLKLPDDDPFWSTPEEPLPSEQYAYYAWFEIPGLFVRNNPSQGHLELFPVRNNRNQWMNDSYYNLYTKFAYSSRFGFTTSSGGRLDQNIRVGNGYRQNPLQADYYRWVDSEPDDPGVLRTVHRQNNTEIRTLIFFKEGAQVRVHRIIGASGERIQDGGYALGLREDETIVPPKTGEDWVYHETSNGAQLTAYLHGFDQTGIKSGSGHHSRFASWQTPYAEISATPDDIFHAATLFYASTSRFPPSVIRDLVESVTLDADLVVIHWSDGSSSDARFP